MRRLLLLGLVLGVLGGCDPIYTVATSRRISAPLDRTCVIETLRMAKSVRKAGVSEYDSARIYAQLIIPEDIPKRDPSDPVATTLERKNADGSLEIDFSINFIPIRESREYEAFVQKTMEALLDQMIERCGTK